MLDRTKVLNMKNQLRYQQEDECQGDVGQNQAPQHGEPVKVPVDGTEERDNAGQDLPGDIILHHEAPECCPQVQQPW